MNVTLNTYALGHKSTNQINKINLNCYGNINNTGLQKDSFEKSPISFLGKLGEKYEDSILFSELELARLDYKPKLAPALKNGIDRLQVAEGENTESVEDQNNIKNLFPETYGQPCLTFKTSEEKKNSKPLKVGVLLSGGQASGGHNVITGLYDALKKANSKSEIYGILGGPKGLIKGKYTKLTNDKIDKYRNQGGFDMLVAGRDKIEKPEDFDGVLRTCKELGLNAVVIIGGDDSNTNAAVLAEWFKQKGEDIKVIGCPKTIDGDLKNEHIETSFGFDTATKTYSEIVGNIAKDTLSNQKYWQFVRVMGRAASHVALEVGVKTHPNITLISEEIKKNRLSTDDVAKQIAEIIAKRAEAGKNYGVAVIPEGLLEFTTDFSPLIKELDKIVIYSNPIADALEFLKTEEVISKDKSMDENLALLNEYILEHKHYKEEDKNAAVIKGYEKLPKELKEELIETFIKAHKKLNPKDLATELIAEQDLSASNNKTFDSMPSFIKKPILAPRDPHGNIAFSQIETEKFLIDKITKILKEMKAKGQYDGKFSTLTDFQGYGGRAGLPSNFDCDYGYSLGYSAAALINSGKTGYIATVNNLHEDAKNWTAGGTPLTTMMNMEERDGVSKPVIQKALVDLDGPVFKIFKQNRQEWTYNDKYLCPGPIQFDGETKDCITKTLKIESANKH